MSLSSSAGSNQKVEVERDDLHLVSTSDEKPQRRPRRRERKPLPNYNDFKVDILEFEGKLDPDEFLE